MVIEYLPNMKEALDTTPLLKTRIKTKTVLGSGIEIYSRRNKFLKDIYRYRYEYMDICH